MPTTPSASDALNRDLGVELNLLCRIALAWSSDPRHFLPDNMSLIQEVEDYFLEHGMNPEEILGEETPTNNEPPLSKEEQLKKEIDKLKLAMLGSLVVGQTIQH